MAHTGITKRYWFQLGTAADSSFLPRYGAGWDVQDGDRLILSIDDESSLRLVRAR